VEEALADLIEKRRMSRPRAHVIAALPRSIATSRSEGLPDACRGRGHP
jgi:hypothetical protein